MSQQRPQLPGSKEVSVYPAHSVRGLYQAPRRPQGVPVYCLRPQILGELGGEATVQKVELAGF